MTSLSFKDKILTTTELRKIYKIIYKLETDIKNMKPEALDCGLATQLATHCLVKSSCMRTAMCYMSSILSQLIRTQTVMKYLILFIMDKTQPIHWTYNSRTAKSMAKQGTNS